MKRVLITGVSGLIGSHLLDELLKRNYRVVGIDNLKIGKLVNIRHNLKNRRFTFVKADILDLEAVKQIARGVDIIIHLAASKKIDEKGDAFRTLRVNVEGTRNIFEAARKKRAKVIFASTSDVYGTSGELPFSEDGSLVIGPPTAKRWTYAVSKIYGEQLAFAYYKEHKVPVVVIRYFGGFSPRASFTWSGGHVPLFIDAVLNNRQVVIHGDGKQTRSMAYVDDLVRGTVLALENPRAIGEIFNIGNDEELSVIDTAHLIHKIANTKNRLKLKRTPHKRIFGTYRDVMRRVPDLEKSKRILGYQAMVDLTEGIKRTIDHRKRLLKSE
ncbi:MAG: NAD-dependent epimerase/dehydratase family protein [Candidatus Omnitrophota bacterium]